MFHKIAGLLLTSPQHASQISQILPHIRRFLARFLSSAAGFGIYAAHTTGIAQWENTRVACRGDYSRSDTPRGSRPHSKGNDARNIGFHATAQDDVEYRSRRL